MGHIWQVQLEGRAPKSTYFDDPGKFLGSKRCTVTQGKDTGYDKVQLSNPERQASSEKNWIGGS